MLLRGLESTIKALLPLAEHRMCARHIWSNWSNNWRGEERRLQFWRCAKSSFVAQLKEEMDALNMLGSGLCEDLLRYNKEKWCRSYFSEYAKCNVVENNMCETFNSWILAPRHKSTISMLEDIRHKMMMRHVEMRKFCEVWKYDIAPMITKVLDDNKDLTRDCKVVWNGDTGAEVLEGDFRHTVNVREKTCSCRTWQLRGIPCQHAICVYYHIGEDPDSHVEHWYRKETFLKAYQYFIQPMQNMNRWPITNNPPIEPPPLKPMPGRPKRCRRKAKNEPKKRWGKATKNGIKMTCSICHQHGHNKSGCPSKNERGQSSSTPAAPTPSQQAPEPIVEGRISSSICDDTSRVRRCNESASSGRGRGRDRGRGRGASAASSQPRSATQPTASTQLISATQSFSSTQPRAAGTQLNRGKRGRGSGVEPSTGFGCYVDTTTGRTVLNPGRPSERVINIGNVKDASVTNIDIGFKPHGLKWKGNNAISSNQLQQQRNATMRSKTNGETSNATAPSFGKGSNSGK